MYKHFNQKLIEIRERMRKKEKLEFKIENIKGELKGKIADRQNLFDILAKEENDVKKLEGISFTYIVHALFGDKEEKLNKEKEEFYRAKLKYDECCNDIDLLEKQMEKYRQMLSQYDSVDIEYDKVIKEKERLILSQNNSAEARDIVDYLERESELKAEIKEAQEAIEVGDLAYKALNHVKDSLEKAKDWGTADLFGGGLISTSMKHSRIDEARDGLRCAKKYLDDFQRELSDVNVNMNININIDNFSKFADYFFDGLFADMNVQSKIKDSLDSIMRGISQVGVIINGLYERVEINEHEINMNKDKINELVEKAGVHEQQFLIE